MFTVTDEEKNEALSLYFDSREPLVLRLFPRKQKRKYLCLLWIIDVFDKAVVYSENEIDDVLKGVYHDYVTLRRYLVDYRLLERKRDGSKYWRA